MLRLFALLLCAAVFTGQAQATEITGKVIKIADGDTLTLLTADKQQVKIRFAEIDTPERSQPYGKAAKQLLSDMAFGKLARVEVVDVDRYGRTVGQVHVNGNHINAALVAQGAAWCYRKYMRGDWCVPLEDTAKLAKRGLWGLQADQRIPPWEWRKNKRKKK
ncbi:MAG: thermonuclease family protein [Oceanococcus sp.]